MAILFAWFALTLLRVFREMMGERDAQWREFFSDLNEKWRAFLLDERKARQDGMARLAEEVKRNREEMAHWTGQIAMLAQIYQQGGRDGND